MGYCHQRAIAVFSLCMFDYFIEDIGTQKLIVTRGEAIYCFETKKKNTKLSDFFIIFFGNGNWSYTK